MKTKHIKEMVKIPKKRKPKYNSNYIQELIRTGKIHNTETALRYSVLKHRENVRRLNLGLPIKIMSDSCPMCMWKQATSAKQCPLGRNQRCYEDDGGSVCCNRLWVKLWWAENDFTLSRHERLELRLRYERLIAEFIQNKLDNLVSQRARQKEKLKSKGKDMKYARSSLLTSRKKV